MTSNTLESISLVLNNIRSEKPLVHHITNYVTVNDCANICLAIGGSPIMADDIEEIEDIVALASAVVLNIGTLNHRTIESMVAAGKYADARGIPVVLDPVGAGASRLRNSAAEKLLCNVKMSVIRGNMSEMKFIAGLQSSTVGVDASAADMNGGLESGISTALSVARKYHCTAAITGAVDIISDGQRVLSIQNGSSKMSSITGTGCMCSSLVGCFCGAADDMYLATAGGVLAMGVSGELSVERVGHMGSGSIRVGIIDAISQLDGATLCERAKIHES